jgi:hypothetical protein
LPLDQHVDRTAEGIYELLAGSCPQPASPGP